MYLAHAFRTQGICSSTDSPILLGPLLERWRLSALINVREQPKRHDVPIMGALLTEVCLGRGHQMQVSDDRQCRRTWWKVFWAATYAGNMSHYRDDNNNHQDTESQKAHCAKEGHDAERRPLSDLRIVGK